MENLSKQTANEAIRGFGMNPEVSQDVRAAIWGIRTRLVQREPENCTIAIDIAKQVETAEILRYFPQKMWENIDIQYTGPIVAQGPEA